MPDRTPEDYEAQYDVETLLRAKKIQNDHGRVRAAQAYAEEQRDAMARIASDIAGSVQKGRFNGAVRGSKMKAGQGGSQG